MKEIDFIKLKLNRLNRDITRELYWSQIRNFLENLFEFNQLLKLHSTEINTQGEKIVISTKCTFTHDVRIRMVVDQRDIRSAPFSILADGFYEPFQADLLLDLGIKSKYFIDIGANMGFYSLALSAVNPKLKVTAFEPQPRIVNFLRENIELNSFTNRIEVLNIALGQHEDSLTLFVPPFTGSGGASFANQHPEEGIPDQLIVPLKLLDDVVKEKVDLIKMDVEGFELNVLLGASRIIKSDKPTIVVELLRKWMKSFGQTPQLFLELMERENYICYSISNNNLVEVDLIDDNVKETNFIFVHQNNIHHIETLSRYVTK